jgi:DNA polymerase I
VSVADHASQIEAVVEALRSRGVAAGSLVGLVVAERAVGFAFGEWSTSLEVANPADAVAAVEMALRPRWVLWSSDAASSVLPQVRLSACFDVSAVHRLLHGGWRADPARVWARAHELPVADLPTTAPVNLFSLVEEVDRNEPVQPDGYLNPHWAAGTWTETIDRAGAWALVALRVAARQATQMVALIDQPRLASTARSESAAELLCADLAAVGLPMNREAIESVIATFIGARPMNQREADEYRHERDARVLAHVPAGMSFDLRSPLQVKSLLRSVGIEVADTRAWRLETLQDQHPMIGELLAWRKAERILTTFGYNWLDEYLGPDNRLRGSWTGCDGAAGRMTATAGLHNMPTDLRSGVMAEPGHVFVRADLGQIEPRVLAVVSGDAALADAAGGGDLYAPVAERLGIDRATAKVAVLGAMYGQTTGKGAEALKGLQRAYPTAMAYLDAADREGQASRSIRTYGGRLIRMSLPSGEESSANDARSRAAAQGRYARNALVQGAAAEFFKVWAVTVRARGAALGAQIVLCLHDELLVHVPVEQAEAAAALLVDCLGEATYRWAPGTKAKFLADVRIITRWSDAKD